MGVLQTTEISIQHYFMLFMVGRVFPDNIKIESYSNPARIQTFCFQMMTAPA